MPSPTGASPFRAFTRPQTSRSTGSAEDSGEISLPASGNSSDGSNNSRIDRFLHERLGRRISLRTNRTSRQNSFNSKKHSQSEDQPDPSPIVSNNPSQNDLKDNAKESEDEEEREKENQLGPVFQSQSQSQTQFEFPCPVKVKPRRNILGRSIYEQLCWTLENDPKWQSQKVLIRTIGFYKIYGELGCGNFAKVKLGVHQLTREKVAIKIIDRTKIEPRFEKMLAREVATMDSLSHRHLIRLFEVIETANKVFLVLEWAPGGDMYTKVTTATRLCEREAKMFFRQVLAAVAYLHTNGMIHRDIKAENIFFANSSTIKLGDFGFATVARRGQLLTTFCGSPPYAAPELFRDASYEGPPVDIWAMGILLFFMLNGHLPFNGSSIPLLKKAILDGRYHTINDLSPEVLDLIQTLLQQIPCKRPTTSEVIRHPWLRLGTSRVSSNAFNSAMSLGAPLSPNEPTSPYMAKDSNLIFVRRESTNLLLPLSQATCKSLPTEEQAMSGVLSLPEMEALRILNEIGIDSQLIDIHRTRGPRSPIMGIYRIILHGIQEGRCWSPRDFIIPGTMSKTASSTNLIKQAIMGRGWKKNAVEDTHNSCSSPQPKEKMKSSACHIL